MQKLPIYCELHGADENILLYQQREDPNFLTMDSKEFYQKSLNTQPSNWHYRNNPVRYNWNANGYRAPEWNTVDWANSIVVMGCSLVAGEGLDEDDTITVQMSKMLDEPVVNLGVPAGSADVLFYNTIRMVDLGIRPKSVIVLSPMWSRTVSFGVPSTNLGPWCSSVPSFDRGLVTYYEQYVRRMPNAEVHGYLSLRGVKEAWENADVPVHVLDQAELSQFVDYSRDLAHPGINTAYNWATELCARLKTS